MSDSAWPADGGVHKRQEDWFCNILIDLLNLEVTDYYLLFHLSYKRIELNRRREKMEWEKRHWLMTGIECLQNIGWHRRLQCSVSTKGKRVCSMCTQRHYRSFWLWVSGILSVRFFPVGRIVDGRVPICSPTPRRSLKLSDETKSTHSIPDSFGCWWNFGVWQ